MSSIFDYIVYGVVEDIGVPATGGSSGADALADKMMTTDPRGQSTEDLMSLCIHAAAIHGMEVAAQLASELGIAAEWAVASFVPGDGYLYMDTPGYNDGFA